MIAACYCCLSQSSPGPKWQRTIRQHSGLGRARIPRERHAGHSMKARQTSKIRKLGTVLVTSGFRTLDEQANALGLPRSTTWTILRANHKASGLTATVINQILAAPQLPTLVRAIILEYVEEKAAGSHGNSKTQLRRFAARLSADCLHKSQLKPKGTHHEGTDQISPTLRASSP